MHRPNLKAMLGIIILLITAAAFTAYVVQHPALRSQLRHTSLDTIGLLLVLYCAFIGSIGLILLATLRLCKLTISSRESLLITMYSSIINFFGPLQSGPAFRALYLKQKHGLKLKDYSLATAAYYLFYAIVSGLLLLGAWLGWGLIIGGVAVVAIVAFFTKNRLQQISLLQRFQKLNLRALYFLFLATVFQAVIQITIYYVELHSVQAHASLNQVIAYTGAANFALFVALTPGAIGFRESFLVFSEHLHHVSNSSIVAANLIDRSVYIVLLVLLAVAIFSTHADQLLRQKSLKTS